jgi:hypothetical protein
MNYTLKLRYLLVVLQMMFGVVRKVVKSFARRGAHSGKQRVRSG